MTHPDLARAALLCDWRANDKREHVAYIADDIAACLRQALEHISAQSARIGELEKRRDELLAAMVRVANETPFADEAKDALAQRGKLVAEVGSLKASVSYWKQEASSAMVRAACAEDATKGYRATLAALAALAALGREACELGQRLAGLECDGDAEDRLKQIELAIAAATEKESSHG